MGDDASRAADGRTLAEAAGAGDEAEIVTLEARPTGDYIDGYLGALASQNAALSGLDADALFYSFDWIGPQDMDRDAALSVAFSAASGASIVWDVGPLGDWRAATLALAERWFSRAVLSSAATRMAADLTELVAARFAPDAPTVSSVAPRLETGNEARNAELFGSLHEHLLFATPDGWFLLEFSQD